MDADEAVWSRHALIERLDLYDYYLGHIVRFDDDRRDDRVNTQSGCVCVCVHL